MILTIYLKARRAAAVTCNAKYLFGLPRALWPSNLHYNFNNFELSDLEVTSSTTMDIESDSEEFEGIILQVQDLLDLLSATRASRTSIVDKVKPKA